MPVKKSPSDFWSFAKLSFQIALYSLVKEKENLTLHQKYSHAPLQ